jgi:hypothetical protein
MNHHYQVVPECYADTLLVEMLGFERPNHQLGIGKVFGSLNKSFQGRVAVGIIDNDKVKPKDLDTFERISEEHGIKRLIKGKHSILVICPAFEDWIFENARIAGVNPEQYGFKNRKSLEGACKKVDAKRNESLKQFFNTLKQKQPPGFLQLKRWICEGAGIDDKDLHTK